MMAFIFMSSSQFYVRIYLYFGSFCKWGFFQLAFSSSVGAILDGEEAGSCEFEHLQ